jgi:hypothetical protein
MRDNGCGMLVVRLGDSLSSKYACRFKVMV